MLREQMQTTKDILIINKALQTELKRAWEEFVRSSVRNPTSQALTKTNLTNLFRWR